MKALRSRVTGYVKQSEVEATDAAPVGESALDTLESGKIATLDAPIEAGTTLWWGGSFGLDADNWLTPEMIEKGPYVTRAPTVHWEVFSEEKAFGLENGSGEGAESSAGSESNAESESESGGPPTALEMPSWEAIEDTNSDLVIDPEQSPALEELLTREENAENVPSGLPAYQERDLGRKRILHHVKDGKELRRAAVKFPSEWGIQNLKKALKDSTRHSERDETSYKKMQWWDTVDATPSRPTVWHYHPVTALKALRAKASVYLTTDETLLREDSGPQVEALQEDLIRLGFDLGPVDGYYGAATEAAVTCLQVETYYHVVDGRLDPRSPFELELPDWEDASMLDTLGEALGEAPEGDVFEVDWSDWAIDGVLGKGTKAAMRGWLDEELTAEYPREINVAKKHPDEPMGFILLDRDNCDGAVYHYQSGVENSDTVERDRMEWWGQPPIVYTLERVCRTWADLDRWEEEWWDPEEWDAPDPPLIQIGDMTRPQGGDYWRIPPEDEELTETEEGWTAVDIREEILVPPDEVSWDPPTEMWDETEYALDHDGHSRGQVADVRPMVSTREQCEESLTWKVDKYDRDLSRKFVEVVKDESPISRGEKMVRIIYFNDPKIHRKYNFVEELIHHNDHYHLKIV